jgi:hypothetical protein
LAEWVVNLLIALATFLVAGSPFGSACYLSEVLRHVELYLPGDICDPVDLVMLFTFPSC